MTNHSNLPRDYLPLNEPTFYILVSLAPQARHGYAIMKDVAALSNGETRLSVSTLYEALSRLLDQGLIERVEPSQLQNTRRSRKTYRLTQLGREVLGAETKRMLLLVEKAHLRMSGDQL